MSAESLKKEIDLKSKRIPFVPFDRFHPEKYMATVALNELADFCQEKINNSGQDHTFKHNLETTLDAIDMVTQALEESPDNSPLNIDLLSLFQFQTNDTHIKQFQNAFFKLDVINQAAVLSYILKPCGDKIILAPEGTVDVDTLAKEILNALEKVPGFKDNELD